MDIRTAKRIELEGRRNQLQQEKKNIETLIERCKVTEQRATETGDGRTALANRKAIEVQKEQLERVAIEEDAITKRLQEYANHKAEAEKLKPEIERLYNQTATKHVNRIIKADNEIATNISEITGINDKIEGLTRQYLMLCGEELYVPTIVVPGFLRRLASMAKLSPAMLQPLEPFTFGKSATEGYNQRTIQTTNRVGGVKE